MFKIIDRYILREIVTPFNLTLATLLLVLLTDQMLRLVELFINKGIPFLTVIRVFFWVLPPFLVIAIPAGVLIGVIIAFTRLSTDSEIIALQANGVSLYRLLWPAIVFSTVAFALTFSLSIWIQPWAGRSLKTLGLSLLKQQAAVALEPGMFNEPFGEMVVYVEEMPSPGHLKGILIYDLKNPNTPILTLAKDGILFNEPESNIIGFRLSNGTQYRFDRSKSDRQQLLRFGSYTFKLDLEKSLRRKGFSQDRLSPEELRTAMLEKPEKAGTYRRLLGAYYKNYAFPFSCLIFGIIGVPIGSLVRRAGRLGGFAVGLFMSVIYYILIVVGDFFATSGVLPPLFSAWVPNLVMSVVTLILIIFMNKGPGMFHRPKR